MTIRAPESRAARVLTAALALGLAVTSCGREPTSADRTGDGVVRLSQGIGFIAEFPAGLPEFQAAGGSGVAFTRVRIVLNNPDGSVALDTVVNFPPGVTELPVTLTVPLPPSAPAGGVPLALNLKYVNAAGDTVFSGGPVTVTAVPTTPGAGPPPPSQVTIPVTYTGPGSNAVAVRISPKTLTVAPNATFNFSAQALDASGVVIPNTPIVFTTDNPVLATINAATGAGTAGAARGSTNVIAQLLTGPTDAATLSIVPPPALLALVSGGGQTANVNAQLAQPVVVRVTASDGVGSPGVTVNFSAGSGGSVGSASATTDASGNASTTWRLGAAAGPQTLTVTSTGLSGSPLSVSATARALDPVRLEVLTQPAASTTAGTPFGLVVRAVDVAGAVTPAFTGTVSLTLGAGAPAGAVLSGTTSVAAVAGVAAFTDVRLTVPGTYTLSASTPTLASVSTASFTIVPGAAATLAFQNYPIVGATAGATLDPVTVIARDAFNNTVTSFTGQVTLTPAPAAAAAGDSGAAAAVTGSQANVVLSGPVTVNAVAGVATFTNLQMLVAGRYALSAIATGLVTAVGPAFNIVPGPASTLSLASGGGQSGPGGAALTSPIVVKVSDAFGNGVGGVIVTFAPVAGSGTVNPVSATSAAGTGLAQTAWTLTGAAGAKTLNASASGLLPNPLVVTATATTSSGFARTWTGATSTAWEVATNWSPAGVPGPADDLTIPVTGNAPNIAAPAVAGSLIVATGATLTNTSTLTVAGSLDAGTTIVGGGEVIVNGATGTLKGNITGNLTVAAGIYTLIADLNVSGSVTINGTGKLDVNNQDLGISGNLVTSAGGRLVMPSGGAVDVAGNVTFGGASTTGQITAGYVRLQGNFTTSGTAYAASGSHTLYLNGTTGTQTLTFTSPVAGQGINHLVLDQASDKVMAGAPEIVGNVSLLINTSPVSGAATVRIGGNFSDATDYGEDMYGGWLVANTEFFGTGRTINTAYFTSNLAITGTVSFITLPPELRAGSRAAVSSDVVRILNPYYAIVNGNVTITGSAAQLTIGANQVYVYGDFATSAGGKLAMTDDYSFLGITGSATFAGGSTAGLLTTGTLAVIGDFTQGGGAANAFAPSGDHITYIGVYYDGGDLRSDVRAPRSRASVPLAVPPGARDPVRRPGAFAAAARAGTEARAAARAAGEARRAAQRARLDAVRPARPGNGTAAFESWVRSIAARRRAVSVPRGSRTATAPGVVVRGQIGEELTGTSTVTFANPTSSGFAHLYIAGNEVVLGSDLNVLGRLETGFSEYFVLTTSGPARVVTSRGADVRHLTFDNVSWVILDGHYISTMDYVTFVNMDPTVDQFSMSRTSDELAPPCDCSSYYYLYWWAFETTPTTGKYIRLNDTNGTAVHTLEVYLEDPSPSTHEGFVATSGGAIISHWPQTFAWTGLGSTDNWNEGANWTTGYPPWSGDNVVIPTGTPRDPYLSVTAAVRNLTIGAGKVVHTNCNPLAVYGDVVTDLAAKGVVDECESHDLTLEGGGDVNSVVGFFDEVTVNGNYQIAGPGNLVKINNHIAVLGNLTINGGMLTMCPDAESSCSGDMLVGGSGTLIMNNAADQVVSGSGSIVFDGANTAGLLTAGTLTLFNGGNLVTGGGSSSAFAPSGSHKVVISGSSAVNFAVPEESFFQNLDILPGGSLDMDSPVIVNGTLTRGAGASAVNITGSGGTTAHLLTASALAGFTTGSPTLISNVSILLGNGASAVFNDVTFSGYHAGFSGSIFAINRSGGPFTFSGLNFSGAGFTPSATAHFIHNVGPANITIAGSVPAAGTLGTHYITTGGTVSWP